MDIDLLRSILSILAKSPTLGGMDPVNAFSASSTLTHNLNSMNEIEFKSYLRVGNALKSD